MVWQKKKKKMVWEKNEKKEGCSKGGIKNIYLVVGIFFKNKKGVTNNN